MNMMNDERTAEPKDRGSASFVLLICVTAASIAAAYVHGVNLKAKSTIDALKVEEAKENAQISNISSLSVLRALLNESRLPTSAYMPAVYPQDYFANKWTFVKNTDIAQPSLQAVSGQTASVLTIASDEWFPGQADNVFRGLKSLTAESQPVEVVSLHHSSVYPYYVDYIDVEVNGSVHGTGKTAILNRARIPLRAPSPGPIELWIREEKEASFTQNFGTAAAPRAAGKYFLQIKGSGVVHYADLTVNGTKQILGLDSAKKIKHAANNVKSGMQVIGTTTTPISGVTASSGPCPVVTASTSQLPLIAQLVGVDGKSANPSASLNKDFYLAQSSSTGSPEVTVANFSPENAPEKEKAKALCIMTNKKIWDSGSQSCTSLDQDPSCANLSSQFVLAESRSILNGVLTNPAKKKVLNCRHKGNYTLFSFLEILTPCTSTIWSYCENKVGTATWPGCMAGLR